MLNEDEVQLLRVLYAYNGVQVSGEINFIPYKMYNLGMITRVTTEGQRTRIQEKQEWWNRKKATLEFVAQLRVKCIEANRISHYYSNNVIALTPIGIKFLEDNNLV